MQRLFLPQLALSLAMVAASMAKHQPARERGVLAEMQSVSCGYMQKTGSTVAGVLITGAQHSKSRELLCQEYVLKTDRVTYRIRPIEEKHPLLLRVGDEAEFRLKKDKMLLRVPESDGKEREYTVLSMVASPELSNVISSAQHPPKPHGVKLDANADSAAETQSAKGASVEASATPAIAAQPTESKLVINSTPAGADIFVDSASAGHTPAAVKVKPGQHSVQVVLQGYRDWVSNVNVAAGGEQTVTANLAQ